MKLARETYIIIMVSKYGIDNKDTISTYTLIKKELTMLDIYDLIGLSFVLLSIVAIYAICGYVDTKLHS